MNCPTCGCPGATMLLRTTPCPNPDCRHYDAGGVDPLTCTVNGTPQQVVHEWLEKQKMLEAEPGTIFWLDPSTGKYVPVRVANSPPPLPRIYVGNDGNYYHPCPVIGVVKVIPGYACPNCGQNAVP